MPKDTVQYDDEGFWLDEWGQRWGTCNSCGADVRAHEQCCEDSEVVGVD
ncbi:hypothetical protein LG293_15980 (plasmid) [Citricoccus nitrophenolicus]